MKIYEYPKNVIDAALAAKEMNYTKLAKKLKRSTQTVHKAVTGNSTIRSSKLEEDIKAELMPELDKIYQALSIEVA